MKYFVFVLILLVCGFYVNATSNIGEIRSKKALIDWDFSQVGNSLKIKLSKHSGNNNGNHVMFSFGQIVEREHDTHNKVKTLDLKKTHFYVGETCSWKNDKNESMYNTTIKSNNAYGTVIISIEFNSDLPSFKWSYYISNWQFANTSNILEVSSEIKGPYLSVLKNQDTSITFQGGLLETPATCIVDNVEKNVDMELKCMGSSSKLVLRLYFPSFENFLEYDPTYTLKDFVPLPPTTATATATTQPTSSSLRISANIIALWMIPLITILF